MQNAAQKDIDTQSDWNVGTINFRLLRSYFSDTLFMCRGRPEVKKDSSLDTSRFHCFAFCGQCTEAHCMHARKFFSYENGLYTAIRLVVLFLCK